MRSRDTSRLKLRLLFVIPNLRATSQGRNVILSFDDDDYSSGPLQKASDASAKVVRREMFKQKYIFYGSLTRNIVSVTVIVSLC